MSSFYRRVGGVSRAMELGFEHRSIAPSGSKARVLAAVTLMVLSFLILQMQ